MTCHAVMPTRILKNINSINITFVSVRSAISLNKLKHSSAVIYTNTDQFCSRVASLMDQLKSAFENEVLTLQLLKSQINKPISRLFRM